MESGVDRFCRRGQHFSQLFTIRIDTLKLNIRQIVGFVQKFQPIFRFRTFLQCNVDLRQKVLSADGTLRFRKICANAGATSQELFGENELPLLLTQISIQIHDPNRESFTFLPRSLLHNPTLHSSRFTLYLFLLQLTASMAMTSRRPGISSPTSS